MKIACLLGVLLHLKPGFCQEGPYGTATGGAQWYNPDHPGYNKGGIPGQYTGAPGYTGGAPGYTGGAPGYNGGAPGYSGGAAGYAGAAPGYAGAAPGYAGAAPGYGSGVAPGYGGAVPGYGGGGVPGYGDGSVPGYGPQGGSYTAGSGGGGYGSVDPNSCAVVIPQNGGNSKKKGKGLCIKYSVVNTYLERALKKRDLVTRLQEEMFSLGVGESGQSGYQGVSSKEYIHYLGEVLLDATEGLADRYRLDKKALNVYLPQIDTSKTVIADFCPDSLTKFYCNNDRYRTPDGSCNNRKYPSWAQSMTPYKRYLSPDYKDLIREPRASCSGTELDLPSPRKLSLTIHQDQKRCAMSANGLHIAFGQFLVHDIAKKQGYKTLQCCDTSDEGDAGHSMCLKMEVVKGDPTYSNYDVSCMSFTRSQISVSEGCKLGVMQQMNAATGTIDLSSVYGSDAYTVHRFRAYDGFGKLITTPIEDKKALLPGRYCEPKAAPDNECLFDAGDSRVSENWGLSVITTIFWRLHNYICDQLKMFHENNQDWNEDNYFNEARHITTAIFQHIAYNEFLPLLLGMKTVKEYGLLPDKGRCEYNDKVNPQIANSLASAGLRACHASIPGFIDSVAPDYTMLNRTYLSDTFFTPLNDCIDNLVRGLSQQCAHAEGASMTDQLRGYMFKADKHFGNDLAAINVQRGRDHGIPGYNKWRKWCGLKPLKTWKDLYKVTDAKSAKLMEKLYLTVDDIDLWTGGVSETACPGAMVGETMACLIGRSFKQLKVGDRYFYCNSGSAGFTPEQLLQIKNIKLSTLLCNPHLTDDIVKMQPWAMALPSDGNEQMACSAQAEMSFSAWMNQAPSMVGNGYETQGGYEAPAYDV